MCVLIHEEPLVKRGTMVLYMYARVVDEVSFSLPKREDEAL